MIYVHSVGSRCTILSASAGTYFKRPIESHFLQFHDRVRKLAAALTQAGFQPGDRLALLLPNGPEYIELVYACGWLGIIAVPINTRLSPVEIDHVLADASPRGLIRHSTLPAPESRVPIEFILDQGHLDGLSGSAGDLN
jgi:acyl-CoA synthetase (AMP-forming)/AMP-acid ligase II